MLNLVKQNIVEQNLAGYNKQFCVRRADVQNLSLVPLLSISKKFGRSASISRPYAKLPDVGGNFTKQNVKHKKIYSDEAISNCPK